MPGSRLRFPQPLPVPPAGWQPRRADPQVRAKPTVRQPYQTTPRRLPRRPGCRCRFRRRCRGRARAVARLVPRTGCSSAVPRALGSRRRSAALGSLRGDAEPASSSRRRAHADAAPPPLPHRPFASRPAPPLSAPPCAVALLGSTRHSSVPWRGRRWRQSGCGFGRRLCVCSSHSPPVDVHTCWA